MNRSSVCVIIFPPPIACVPLVNITSILSLLIDDIYLITSKESIIKKCFKKRVKLFTVSHKASSNSFSRVFNYINTQIKILSRVVYLAAKVDIFFFSLGGEYLIFPIVVAKLCRKKVIVMPGGSGVKTLLIKKDPFSRFLSLVVQLNLLFIDELVLYSTRLFPRDFLEKHIHKIKIAHEHFVDFTKFMKKKKITERDNVIGYLGRLSVEKGVLNFIHSIPLIVNNKNNDVKFRICGKGELIVQIEEFLKIESLNNYVRIVDWISHDDVMPFLNEIKLFVLPSYTEGLPNVILEAMSCGTPVLATKVGAVPELIRDNETGFLLNSNDPVHIAAKINQLLSNSRLLEEVSKNATKWVRKNYTKQKTLEIWKNIFQDEKFA